MEVNGYTKTIAALGRPQSYYPTIAEALGSIGAAIFINPFIHAELQADAEGWVHGLTAKKIQAALKLNYTEQTNARELLCRHAILEEKKEGMPAKLIFRYNAARFDEFMSTWVDARPVVTQQPRAAPVPKPPAAPKAEKLPKVQKIKPEADEKAEAFLKQAGALFEAAYKKTQGADYVWGGRQERSRRFQALKGLCTQLHQAQWKFDKEANADAPEPTEQQVLDNLVWWLSLLPVWHIDNSFDPIKLNAQYNTISAAIRGANKGTKSGRAAYTAADLREFS